MNTMHSPVTHEVSGDKISLAKKLRRNLTPAERRLWHSLKAERLYGLHFRRQQSILGFIVDFYCHRVRLAVEVDGDVHVGARDYDKERDSVLGAKGIRVIRFWNDQVFDDLPRVLQDILQAARPDPPPSPLPKREGE
jgi:very-short-patch-repair endonuclease